MTQTNRVPETVEIKYKGVWTPKYMAERLLFPKPAEVTSGEGMLKAWAHDIVEENNSSLLEEIKTLKEEKEKLEKSVQTFNTINTEIREHCRLVPGESIIQHIKHLEFIVKTFENKLGGNNE